jgi:hypothetical protein
VHGSTLFGFATCSVQGVVHGSLRQVAQNGTFRSIGRNFEFAVIGKDRRNSQSNQADLISAEALLCSAGQIGKSISGVLLLNYNVYLGIFIHLTQSNHNLDGNDVVCLTKLTLWRR